MSHSLKAQKWTPLGIFAVVLGFIVWWPLGLAAIAYILWGGRMKQQWDDQTYRSRNRTNNNEAFDTYRRETLDRLDDEQQAFADYVDRLRKARDQDEFSRFMKEQRATHI